jgi:hypothetical protein
MTVTKAADIKNACPVFCELCSLSAFVSKMLLTNQPHQVSWRRYNIEISCVGACDMKHATRISRRCRLRGLLRGVPWVIPFEFDVGSRGVMWGLMWGRGHSL